MPVARLADIDIYYEIHGQGDWLILLHGGGGTHLDWWKQVYLLRDKYKCLIYDLRGMGQSTGREDYANGGRDLIALMDHLEIEKAFINGHSAGGWAASTTAQHHPERVRALVMTGSHFGFFTPALKPWAERMLEKMREGFDVWEHMFSPKFAARDPEMHFLQRSVGRLNAAKLAAARAERTQYSKAYVAMRDTPAADYSGFGPPALFIVGADDTLTTPTVVKGTAAAVRGARYVEIPDAGHYVLAEQPVAYHAALTGFLKEIP